MLQSMVVAASWLEIIVGAWFLALPDVAAEGKRWLPPSNDIKGSDESISTSNLRRKGAANRFAGKSPPHDPTDVFAVWRRGQSVRMSLEKKSRVIGRVKWFAEPGGYGLIACSDGPNVFVHATAILGEGRRTLSAGDVVEFEILQGESGPLATNVIVCPDGPSGPN